MPSVRFQCPSCKATSSVNDRMLGREIKCPTCSAPVQLPKAERLAQMREERQLEKKLQSSLTDYSQKKEAARPPDLKHPSRDSIVTNFAEEQAIVLPPRTLPKDDMDMTPMVDVTFLLLIFFMITANFTQQKAIQVPAQKKQEASTNAIPEPTLVDDLVTIQIDELNAYLILPPDGSERPAPSKQDLIVALGEIRNESSNAVDRILIQAHQDCIHAAVINALDAGRDKGFTSLQVTVVQEFQ